MDSLESMDSGIIKSMFWYVFAPYIKNLISFHCEVFPKYIQTSECHLNHISDLNFRAGSRNLIIQHHTAAVARLVRHGSALDDTGYLQIFV